MIEEKPQTDSSAEKTVTASSEEGDAVGADTAADAKKVRGNKKTYKQVVRGRAYVQSTYNNTIVTLSDESGNVLASSSSGKAGFKGAKKSTAYAAGIVVRDAVAKTAPFGLKEVEVFVKGLGSGRDAAIRAFNAQGLYVLSIKDVTPIPHNGCRPRKVRRV